MAANNFYNKLQVPRNATNDDIRHAYFEAARRLHPDANPMPGAAELFIQMQQAYEVLVDPLKRAKYDANLPFEKTPEPEISLSFTFSRPSLSRLDEPQLIYALADVLSTTTQVDTEALPLNLCLVLDRSTSMQGARMDMVKANAIRMLRQMRPGDIISVVAFSDRAEVLAPAVRSQDINKVSIRISLIQPGGSTEILKGLEAGIEEVSRFASSDMINHLILLTDGRTYGDEDLCISLAEEAASNGIGISGLGIGHEWNDAFLDRLAGISGGSSMYISAPRDLRKYLEKKVSSLSKVYAEKVQLDLTPGEGVEIRYAFRLQPESGPLTFNGPARLGNVLYGRSLSFILELLVQPLKPEMKRVSLAAGKITMDIPSRVASRCHLPMNLVLPVAAPEENVPTNPAVMQALSRLTLYRMQEKARQEVEAGEFSRATRHLQYLATHLLARGEHDLAHTVLAEAENIQQGQHYSQEGDKRIKYGTRALLLPPGSE